MSRMAALPFLLFLGPLGAFLADAQDALRVFISVDMEGISGIGVEEMTESGGKDYEVGRRMLTSDVNAVIAGVREAAGESQILVNDSHGDHRNVLIEELAGGVDYIQGSVKPFGMMEGLDESFDAVIFIGYHARAGTRGFLSHTGSGRVRELRIDGVPAGEGEMNAALAGSYGVPVILVSGDAAYVEQARGSYAATARAVVTKIAVTNVSAQLRPVDVVRSELREQARLAIAQLDEARPWGVATPVRVEMDYSDVTSADIAEHVPAVSRMGPFSIRFETEDMSKAHPLIRILYRFLSWR